MTHGTSWQPSAALVRITWIAVAVLMLLFAIFAAVLYIAHA